MSSHIEKRKQTFKVRDTKITILANARIDDDTNEVIFDQQIDNEAINLDFNKYRNENGLVAPKEMVEFRNNYNLSQSALAKLMEISTATIARYEKGALPPEGISDLLKQLVNDNSAFVEFFKQNRNSLSIEDRKRVETILLHPNMPLN